MQVWDANGTGNIHFDSQSLCEPTLGYIIENRIIQAAINSRLSKLNNISNHCPAALEQLEIKTDKAEVVLDNGTRISAKLIIGADGVNSRVRELANIDSATHDYQQSALVCTVKSQIAHHDTARQRFLSTGPLAFLPLADPHTCSIVWSTTPDQAQELKNMSDEEFHRSLEEAFESTLGKILQTGPRYTFPLGRAHAKNYVKNRIALIGDAAHRVHPLAGQGANLGILDAATLAEVLAGQQNNDIGKMSLLRKYERWRKGENLSVLIAMDGFKHAYGSSQSAIQKIRNVGMNAANASPSIKRLIMLNAMGLSGDLPKVARTPHFL
jgi:2-octaprenylphenol hydroxylase